MTDPCAKMIFETPNKKVAFEATNVEENSLPSLTLDRRSKSELRNAIEEKVNMIEIKRANMDSEENTQRRLLNELKWRYA